jgi:hypothetical protein
MARVARFKILNDDAWYHIHSRIAGRRGYYPLSEEASTRKLIDTFERFTKIYFCTIAAFCVMGSHYHFVIKFEASRPVEKNELQGRARLMYPSKTSQFWNLLVMARLLQAVAFHGSGDDCGLVADPAHAFGVHLEGVGDRDSDVLLDGGVVHGVHDHVVGPDLGALLEDRLCGSDVSGGVQLDQASLDDRVLGDPYSFWWRQRISAATRRPQEVTKAGR